MKGSIQVLLVEDDTLLREAFTLIVGKAGYRVDTAANGQEALEFLKQNHPRLILLDLLMPVMTGLEFLKRYQRPTPCPIIVVLSNIGDHKQVEAAIELGADCHFVKSELTPDALLQVVSDSLALTPRIDGRS